MTHKLIETALLEQLVVALEIAKEFCGQHTAEECSDTVALPINAAFTAGRAALEGAESTGWQKIETAPKDGTTVYASGINYNTPSRGRHFCLAHFHEGMWYETSDWNSSSTLEYLDMWAPLPAAPKEQP